MIIECKNPNDYMGHNILKATLAETTLLTRFCIRRIGESAQAYTHMRLCSGIKFIEKYKLVEDNKRGWAMMSLISPPLQQELGELLQKP